MGVIVINGKRHTYTGSLSIVNNEFFVNGKKVTDWNDIEENQKHIDIKVEGNVEKIDIDCCDTLSVKGNVGKVRTTSGDIEISGDVDGDVQTVSGSVYCGNVDGDVQTVSGDIRHK